MPIIEFEEFKRYPDLKGVFVGGCVERGDGSSFSGIRILLTFGKKYGPINNMKPGLQIMPKDNQLMVFNEMQSKTDRIFNNLDISESTRSDYKYRIGLFLGYMRERC